MSTVKDMRLHWSLLFCPKMVAETSAIVSTSISSWKEKSKRKKGVRVLSITLSCFLGTVASFFFFRKAKNSSNAKTIALKMLLNCCWIRYMREIVKHLERNHKNLKNFLVPFKDYQNWKFWKMHYWCVLCEKRRNFIGCNNSQRKFLTL